MKKLYIMLLALILVVAMIIPMAIPVIAAAPNVVGTVTGCHYGGYDPKPVMGFGGNLKLLSDGTIVGSWKMHFASTFDEASLELPDDLLANTEWKLDLEQGGMEFLASNVVALGGIFQCVSNNNIEEINSYFPAGLLFGFIIFDNGSNDSFMFIGDPNLYEMKQSNFQVKLFVTP